MAMPDWRACCPWQKEVFDVTGARERWREMYAEGMYLIKGVWVRIRVVMIAGRSHEPTNVNCHFQ
jgi:hypothetical protein